ncbi:bidirectional sugar transporter SWEET14-like, partial [Henckelia pumila]|uniref:bidirectional sugar transporter SWEET14-like n=1 Tax=Henckelia pumila TaxID=405737 RepID=UPI003C6E645E
CKSQPANYASQINHTEWPWRLAFLATSRHCWFTYHQSPTFHKIFKKKSTEGFQSIPYSVALLYMYYVFLKPNAINLVINSVGCVFELSYLPVFMLHAKKESKISTTKILLLFNTLTFGCIVACSYMLFTTYRIVTIIGCICVGFSVAVFASPFGIMRRVMRTNSVEFMPTRSRYIRCTLGKPSD